MAITEQSLLTALKKKKIAPAYFLHGKEQFLVEKYMQAILDHALTPGDEDFNLDLLYGNETEGSQIVNTAMAFPMMADRRVVIVKNIHLVKDPGLDLLIKYLKKPSSTTCLVLSSASKEKKRLRDIAKLCDELECSPIKDYKIPEWIKEYLKGKHLKITEEALRFLHGHAGSSLQNISSEIDKIVLNLDNKDLIDIGDVEAVVGISKQYNVFELCDRVGHKDIVNSIHIVNQLIQLGEAPGMIISQLARHFQRLIILKELKADRKSNDDIAKVIKCHPFFVKNYTQQANKFDWVQINKVFKLLLETDVELKSSRQKPILLLELFLLKLKYL